MGIRKEEIAQRVETALIDLEARLMDFDAKIEKLKQSNEYMYTQSKVMYDNANAMRVFIASVVKPDTAWRKLDCDLNAEITRLRKEACIAQELQQKVNEALGIFIEQAKAMAASRPAPRQARIGTRTRRSRPAKPAS